jgi:geranylgeranyl diphosphate synthase type I
MVDATHADHWEELLGYMTRAVEETRLPGIAREMFEYQLRSGGKRIRPGLAMMVEDAYLGRVERILPFAAAAELLHNASLVHDDLQDEDERRREQPTVWRAFSAAQAINLGDLVFTLGLKLIDYLEVPGARKFEVTQLCVDCLAELVSGQILEFDLKSRGSYTEEDYLAVASKKTASLFRLVLKGAALLCDAPQEDLQEMVELGEHLGVAFQVRDDIVDVTGRKEGRAAGGDIREGKTTLMAAHLLNGRAPDPIKAEVRAILACPKTDTSDSQVDRAVELYLQWGAVDHARQHFRERCDRVRAAHLLVRRPRLRLPLEALIGQLARGI